MLELAILAADKASSNAAFWWLVPVVVLLFIAAGCFYNGIKTSLKLLDRMYILALGALCVLGAYGCLTQIT